jgi:copper homeostasis protein
MLLEVIVQSVEDALAATAGGADRLEVVRDIQRDGLTPAVELVRDIGQATSLPLRVMVRDADTFTAADPRELAGLQRAFEAFAGLGVGGAVVGFARDGRIDLDTTRAVLSAAPSLHVTFHRAFDTLHDPLSAIGVLGTLPQIDRILTSGGSGDWSRRLRRLSDCVAAAAPRITILAGGGVDEEGLRLLASTRTVTEAHVGRAACEPQQIGAAVSADRVRLLKQVITNATASASTPRRPLPSA